MADTDTASAELVRQVAAVDEIPTVEQVDSMIVAAYKTPPCQNREDTINDLLDFRANLVLAQTSVERDAA